VYKLLGDKDDHVAIDEGNDVLYNGKGGFFVNMLQECEDACTETKGCHSFAYCENTSCWLKDKVFNGDEKTKYKRCATYYELRGPTELPTGLPTKLPTELPTGLPTTPPTESPTENPTTLPTELPTGLTTTPPTESPTRNPTRKVYKLLGDQKDHVAVDEGNEVLYKGKGGFYVNTLQECKDACTGTKGCHSFAYCLNTSCWLKDKVFNGDEKTKYKLCATYYEL